MLRSLDLAVLNSATKYPSIPTYHALDPANGNLLDTPMVFPGEVVATEKVDGTNGRVILFSTGEYVIGSREELLTASGDIISNPSQGIVNALKPLADRLQPPAEDLQVFYLEVYGGKVGGASKQYTSTGGVGHRLFDVARIPTEVLSWLQPRVSAWRDAEGQQFADETHLQLLAENQKIARVPHLVRMHGADLPTDLVETREFLAELLPRTRVALDAEAGGRPEGVVLRSDDRSVIVKARFQDYDRTLRRLQGTPRGR